jgi:hypothetical protein
MYIVMAKNPAWDEAKVVGTYSFRKVAEEVVNKINTTTHIRASIAEVTHDRRLGNVGNIFTAKIVKKK